MKICIIAPAVIPISSNLNYGGTELVVSNVTEELVRQGHEVYLMAAGDSITSAKLVPTVDKAIGQGVSYIEEKKAARRAYELSLDIKPDIIWDNTLAYHAQTIKKVIPGITYKPEVSINPDEIINTGDIPILQTLHGNAVHPYVNMVKLLAKKNHYFAAISNAQKLHFLPYAGSQLIGVAYNSVNAQEFAFSKDKQNYLLWVGRYTLEKGAEIALRVAHKIGMPIKLVGKLSEEHEKQYFKRFIENQLHPEDEVFHQVNTEEKIALFQHAHATIMPILWDEPFGIVTIESMSTGTPVIGGARGALPEVIGDTGVLVPTKDLKIDYNKGIDERDYILYFQRFFENVKKINGISPMSPRQRVLDNFTPTHSAKKYETLFEKAIAINRTKKLKNVDNYLSKYYDPRSY